MSVLPLPIQTAGPRGTSPRLTRPFPGKRGAEGRSRKTQKMGNLFHPEGVSSPAAQPPPRAKEKRCKSGAFVSPPTRAEHPAGFAGRFFLFFPQKHLRFPAALSAAAARGKRVSPRSARAGGSPFSAAPKPVSGRRMHRPHRSAASVCTHQQLRAKTAPPFGPGPPSLRQASRPLCGARISTHAFHSSIKRRRLSMVSRRSLLARFFASL